MLLIPCPWCGPRHESEFENAGPVRARRAHDPGALSDAQWLDYLLVRPNPCGALRERWWHARGCGEWFEIIRHTATHELLGTDDER